MRRCKKMGSHNKGYINKVYRASLLSMALASATLSFAQNAVVAQNADASAGRSWQVVRENAQHSFALTVSRGNYSGITHLHDDVYAVVSDKSDSALYFNFRIQIDPVTGEVERVENLGYVERVDGSRHDGNQVDGKVWQSSETGFDHEAIAKVSDSTLVVASEGFCRLKEYPIIPSSAKGSASSVASKNDAMQNDGWQDAWQADLFYPNYNFESLAYDSVRHYLWTMPESVMRKDGTPATPENPVANKLRLIRYTWSQEGSEKRRNNVAEGSKDSRLEHVEYAYLMDKPSTTKKAETYVMGVSELCSLPDGQLLVLEREAFIPKIKLGAFCRCKLYVVNPLEEKQIDAQQALTDDAPFVKKRLLTEWKTNLSIFDFSFANYEGMCLGPETEDGSRVLILLSDSQDQYAGILRDYFKTIVIAKQ